MLKVGITGGIGVGKTYVANVLERMGYPVFYADRVAKDLVNNERKLIDLIKLEFGEDIYLEDNKLDSKKLSLLAFNDHDVLNSLNKIIHPFVLENFRKWCDNQNSDIVFKEAAILFETKSNLDLDKVICVTADKKNRIRRVLQRDERSESEIKKIISKQMDQEEKEILSDYILNNNGNESILFQISKILKDLE